MENHIKRKLEDYLYSLKLREKDKKERVERYSKSFEDFRRWLKSSQLELIEIQNKIKDVEGMLIV